MSVPTHIVSIEVKLIARVYFHVIHMNEQNLKKKHNRKHKFKIENTARKKQVT